MTRLYVRWNVNPLLLPKDPEDMVKLWFQQLEWVKGDLASGTIKDWGQCCNGRTGYCISELSEPDFFTNMMKYMPVIEFNITPILSVDESIDSVKKAVAAAQAK